MAALSLVNIGGVVPIRPLADLQKEAQAAALQKNNSAPIQGLAGHIRKVWEAAKRAKENTVEQRMLQSVRQRRGEYDPDKLSKIQEQGGSEIFMMLTSGKCRAGAAWLRDVLLQGKPWSIDNSPVPELPDFVVEEVFQEVRQELDELMQLGVLPSAAQLRQYIESRRMMALNELKEYARKRTDVMERKMDDQLTEGGFYEALDKFIDDITTFPAAILKGPVIRKRPRLRWDESTPGAFNAVVEDKLVLEWERVDPFNAYPAAHCSDFDDGDFIERHKLTRGDLQAMRGVEGYNDDAIDSVLREHGIGGLHEWISIDTQKAEAEEKDTNQLFTNDLIDALQFWGSVPGKLLIEWGLDGIEKPESEYSIEAWLIGSWVIKATLNPDPMGRKPYYKASFESIPGAFWGNAITDLIRDVQNVCNASARALVNNMGIASGPQVWINVDRLPPGETITQMYPWKIWQTTSDPIGSTAPPADFFQPNSHASELMMIYEKFSNLADEYSGIPRYMTGEAPGGGAGRTASGLSMLVNNAGKVIKQVLSGIDNNVLEPLVERLYYHNMRYSEDPELKGGDVFVVAKGAEGLMAKEAAQVRRNEFLAATANPIDSQIMGPEGRAVLLHEAAKGLDMNADKIVPDPDVMRARMAQMQLQASMQPQPQAPAGAQQQPNPTQNQQTLMNGAPITDNFSPPPNP